MFVLVFVKSNEGRKSYLRSHSPNVGYGSPSIREQCGYRNLHVFLLYGLGRI